MKLTPQQNYIAVRVKMLRPSKTILIPDKSSAPAAQLPYCEVIDIGPDVKLAAIGDKCIILPGNLIGFIDPNHPDDEKMCIMLTREDNIMGKYIEDGEPLILN